MWVFFKIKRILLFIQREILFNYMNHNKKDAMDKLTLKRKVHRTLSISSVSGKNKNIKIEVRKKRTYVKCIPQEFSVDIKNKIEPDTIATEEMALKNFLLANKEIHNPENSLSSIKKFEKNNYFSEVFISQKKQSRENISHQTLEGIAQTEKKDRLLLKKHESRDYSITKFVIDASNNNSSELHRMSIIDEKINDKKLENAYKNRSRARMRNRSGNNSRLIKQKRNNNYRLYNIVESISDDVDKFKDQESVYDDVNRLNKNKRKKNNSSALIQDFHKPSSVIVHNIIIGETISVAELARKMSIKGSCVIKVMMKLGLMVTINQMIDQETAQLVVEEIGHNVILHRENALEESIMNDRIDKCDATNKNVSMLKKRAPIVTIMGHVDHGKTSLLDYIRSTKIASLEAGGITQSIGAYHVNVNNDMITFIDTPGHAAFTSMRARGVKLTDIIVLVVAADDGVMPQTIEAIKHAQIANVPIVVAINKIDKSEINVEHIKNELNKYGVISEDWGGDVQFVKISAITGEGVNNLLDAILLQSEMLELKVSHNVMANAVVIDSFIDKGKGPVVTVLVREGTLRCSDVVLCGTVYGRVRGMRDEYGCSILSVGPSIPVELLGLSGTPIAGEIAVVVRDEKKAKEVALYRQSKFREIDLSRREKKSNLENVFVDIKNIGKISELYVILKASTQGFVEAICDALMKLSTDKIIIKILSASIGGITETDAVLARTSNAIILGFNVRADLSARRIIELEKLDIRYYSVIYDLLNEMTQLVQGMLVPDQKCEIIGSAEVRNVFCSPRNGNIAGCMVIEGVIKRLKKIRIIRNNIVIYNGELGSLRRFKIDVNEVKSGIECGIGIKNYNDISLGDVIEVFDMVQTSTTC